MHVFLLGVSHQTAPIDVREQLDFSSRDVGAAVEALAARYSAGEAVVLSTCNRSEIYVASDDPARARAGTDRVPRQLPQPAAPRPSKPHVFVRTDEDGRAAPVPRGGRARFAGRRRAADPRPGQGRVPGGRRRGSASARCSRGCSTPRSASASACARKPALGEGAVSVGFAAVALARKIFGRLDGRRVLVVGAGEISTLTAQHLRVAGRRRHRDHQPDRRARRRARGRGGRPRHPLGRAARRAGRGRHRHHRHRLAAADPHPCATSRPSPGGAAASRCSSSTSPCRATSSRRSARSSRCSSTTSTTCRPIVQENLSRRSSEIGRAESIVAEEVERFSAWRRSRGAVPTVVALRQRFEQIRRAELQRLESKLGGLPPEARASVDEVTRLIVEKLLLAPTAQLKALPDEETQIAYTEAVNRLFELRDDDAADARRTRRWTPSGRIGHAPRMAILRLGTRGSALALVQARAVAALLLERTGVETRDRRHQDLGRPARRREAVGDRRQGAVRQGNRGRAAGRDHRPGGAQQQGHAGPAARRPGGACGAAARGPARCAGAAGCRPRS